MAYIPTLLPAKGSTKLSGSSLISEIPVLAVPLVPPQPALKMDTRESRHSEDRGAAAAWLGGT
jgi:hypothetical protein